MAKSGKYRWTCTVVLKSSEKILDYHYYVVISNYNSIYMYDNGSFNIYFPQHT